MAEAAFPSTGSTIAHVSIAFVMFVLVGCKQREKPAPQETSTPKPKRVQHFEACAVPDTVNGPVGGRGPSYHIPKGCKLRVEKDWIIDNDAHVTIGAGATISFTKGTGLYVVHGDLTTFGSPEEPVRFTSAEPSPAPGDWRGIVVDQAAFGMGTIDGDYNSYDAGVSLDHAIVEYTGGDVCPAPPEPGIRTRCTRCSRGAFTLSAGRVASQRFYQVTFRNNRDAHIDTTCMRGAFAQFSSVKLDGKTPIHVQLGTAASLHDVTVPIVLAPGLIEEEATLPTGEYHIDQMLRAEVLTISPGSTLRISPAVRLAPRKLMAKNVLFTWTGVTPWAGLSLESPDSSLDGCTFEHAAGQGTPKAVIDLSRSGTLHHVWDNTFRDLQAPAFFVTASVCAELTRQNNHVVATSLCTK